MLSPIAQSALNRLRYMWLPPAKVGICRVLHDRECSRPRGGAKLPYLSRFYDPKLKNIRGLPETIRFNGGRGTVSLSTQWQVFFQMNNTPQAHKYLTRLQSGWVNYGPWPKIEQLCTASPQGTFVLVDRIEGNRAYIYSYQNDRQPSDYVNIDYLQLFGVAYSDDSISLPDCGKAYTFAIRNPSDGELWVDTRDLTFIRAFPAITPTYRLAHIT